MSSSRVAGRFPFTPFPDGIFAVALANEVRPKEIKAITFMGEEVVLFKTEQGAVGALLSYCPHLGANLAGGCVKQETLQCPFHGLRFNKHGLCLTKSRRGACYQVKKWDAFEQYGMIFLIHHPLGNSLNINFPKWNLGEWGHPITTCFKIKSHPQEVLENSVDQLHFFKVHNYLAVKNLKPLQVNGTEFLIQYLIERREGVFGLWDRNKIEMKLDIHAYGLGMSKVEIELPQYGLTARQIVFPTPIDGQYIHVRTLTSIKIPKKIRFIPSFFTPHFARKKLANYLSRIALKGFLKDFIPDLTIWENKRYITDPDYLLNDGDFQTYRAWAKQFYRLNEETIQTLKTAR